MKITLAFIVCVALGCALASPPVKTRTLNLVQKGQWDLYVTTELLVATNAGAASLILAALDQIISLSFWFGNNITAMKMNIAASHSYALQINLSMVGYAWESTRSTLKNHHSSLKNIVKMYLKAAEESDEEASAVYTALMAQLESEITAADEICGQAVTVANFWLSMSLVVSGDYYLKLMSIHQKAAKIINDCSIIVANANINNPWISMGMNIIVALSSDKIIYANKLKEEIEKKIMVTITIVLQLISAATQVISNLQIVFQTEVSVVVIAVKSTVDGIQAIVQATAMYSMATLSLLVNGFKDGMDSMVLEIIAEIQSASSDANDSCNDQSDSDAIKIQMSGNITIIVQYLVQAISVKTQFCASAAFVAHIINSNNGQNCIGNCVSQHKQKYENKVRECIAFIIMDLQGQQMNFTKCTTEGESNESDNGVQTCVNRDTDKEFKKIKEKCKKDLGKFKKDMDEDKLHKECKKKCKKDTEDNMVIIQALFMSCKG